VDYRRKKGKSETGRLSISDLTFTRYRSRRCTWT
jgi:hypothetical protein